jgi:hypothetical protein
MTNRVSIKQLEILCDTINELTGSPMKPYEHPTDGGRMIPQAGNYHLSQAYGGVCLHRMSLNGGSGVTCPLEHYHAPKRELFNSMHGFISGIRTAQECGK